jgi:hypothetical protein
VSPEATIWTTDSGGYVHDDERCAWQHASSLIGGGGDPSDVTPAALERYMRELDRVVECARRLRDAMQTLDAARTDHHENKAYGDVQSARRALEAALAELPREQ